MVIGSTGPVVESVHGHSPRKGEAMAWRIWGVALMVAGVACVLGLVAVQVRADRRAGHATPLPPWGRVLLVAAAALAGWGVVLATVGLFSA